MKRVLFYDDVPIYGGHQATAIAAARHLADSGFEVISAFSAANARMHAEWSALRDTIRLIPLELRLTRWQPFLSPFGVAATPVRELIQDVRPDVIIAVQGTIVQSNRGVEQARRLGVPVVSFVPMGVHFARGQWLQQFVSRILERYHYRRPDAFMTTSRNAQRELLGGRVRAPIHVVYAGAPLASLTKLDRAEARQRLALSGYTIAIIGRVSIGTKGHDVLLRALTHLDDVHLLIVGDGPDDEQVDRLIAKLGLRQRVARLPWQRSMSAVYSAVDLVVIPSWFEGLPQVALEAMYFELPVVATDMGAMREILPAEWICPVGDPIALAGAISSVRANADPEALHANRERILQELNEEAFGERFRTSLLRIGQGLRPNG